MTTCDLDVHCENVDTAVCESIRLSDGLISDSGLETADHDHDRVEDRSPRYVSLLIHAMIGRRRLVYPFAITGLA